VFKRLREGLFGRPDESAPETAAETAPAPRPETAGETAPETAAAAEAEPQATTQSPSSPAAALPAAPPAPPAPPAQTRPEPGPERGAGRAAARQDAVDVAAATQPVSPEPHGGVRVRNPFKRSLGRTRQLFGRVTQAFEEDEEISPELWDELEETLISGDVGVQTTDKLMQTLRDRAQAEGMTHARQLRDALKEELELMLGEPEPLLFSATSPISVYLIVGVNGVGKTTTIAKLGNQLKRQKHRVMLAAGDTFRAAAIEQLRTWGERVGLPVISHQHGADPGAVVYDAMQAAQARGADVLIVDTAGRLHTKFNLMEELKKIMRVLQKYDPEAPHEVLLVMDATVGQNGLLQAKQFVQDAGVSGVVLTKLDGTARGGIVFAVAAELGLPIKFIGTGEQVGDLAPFDPVAFVDALFEEE